MSRTSLGTLAGLALAALVAARLGGSTGTGVLAGYIAGAALGLTGYFWQRAVLRTEPARVYSATVAGFLLMLAGVFGGALTLRFFAPLGELADWRGFLPAYAVAAYLSLMSGAIENRRALMEESTP